MSKKKNKTKNKLDKISLLVVFIKNHIGGATTSLINFLNTIDGNKYDVDVLFYENDGNNDSILSNVNILPQAMTHEKLSVKNIIFKFCYPPYLLAKIKSEYVRKVKHNRIRSIQIMSKQGCRYSRRINKEYDLAIAYELNWCINYVVKYINAKKKIVYIHNDYYAIGYDFKVDKKSFDKVDAIVFVSEECKKKFLALHEEYRNKSFFMPNLLPTQAVLCRADEKIAMPFQKEETTLTMLTIARIQFATKGLDRVIPIFCRLREEGLLDKIRWLVIGKGKDLDELLQMVKDNHLEKNIYLLGLKENPIPYMKECDILFLPSRNEGKPMVVTEAQIMGLVPVVAKYTSATEQIKNGFDGLIFENNDEAIYEGLKGLILNPQRLKLLKGNLSNGEYGNEKEISRFYGVLEEIM